MSPSSAAPPSPAARPDPQALVGYRTNAEWTDLVAQVGAMLSAIEDIPDAATQARVVSALQGIDEIHREALHRLVRLFKDGVLEQVITDPSIKTLMGMYDLLPPEAPGCAKTIDFLTPEERAASVAGSSSLLQAQAIPSLVAAAPQELPRWTPAPLDSELTNGRHALAEFDGHHLILARVRDEDFAVDAVCTHHHVTMSGGTLNAYAWMCPSGPGCAYDVRNGARMGGGASLVCHPVRRDDRGRLLVGFGMPFKPAMPSF